MAACQVFRFTARMPKLEPSLHPSIACEHPMSKRPLTAHQRAWLLEELSLWRRDAIVTEQQAERIAGLYEGAGEMAERGRSKAVMVLMAAAATLVGLAALLLIGYNWSDLPR